MTDKEKLFEELEAKIKAFTEAHKDEDPEEIINVCRGNWWPEEPVSEDLEEASGKYADEKLKIARPDIFNSAYSRPTKMTLAVFGGYALEDAFEDGAAWDRERIIAKACEWWLNEFAYPTMTDEEKAMYQEKVAEFRKAMEAV